jgi:predicted transcriptional regulator
MTEGARAFRAFRERHGINHTQAAEALKVSRAAIYAWEDGEKVPDAEPRDRIEVWTDGEVSRGMWRDDAAAQKLADVRPFSHTPDAAHDSSATGTDGR